MDAGGAGQRMGFQEPAEGRRLHVEPVGHVLGPLPGRQGSGQAHGVGDRVAARVGRRLLEPDFFSGWGIRTVAAGQRPYHPLSYHRGNVWPHDNAIAVVGLNRYGLHGEAAAVIEGLIAAAAHIGYRLPEVLAGHSRADHPTPVPYPHSASPQAWAGAAPLAFLTAAGGAPLP